jgi:uncharacterized membrane protein
MLDYLLAFYLVLVLPAQQLWKSVHKSKGIGRTRTQRYWKSIGGVIVPMAIVAVNSWWLGRAPAALGLDRPVSSAGLWGLAIAVALLNIGTTGAVILSALAYGVAHGYANPRQLAVSYKAVNTSANPAPAAPV